MFYNRFYSVFASFASYILCNFLLLVLLHCDMDKFFVYKLFFTIHIIHNKIHFKMYYYENSIVSKLENKIHLLKSLRDK